MEEFKKYYKFPLKMWDDFYCKVFTQDNNMAFDWKLPYNSRYDDTKKRLLDRINGLEVESKHKDTEYYLDGINIMARTIKGEIKVAVVRGWGMLTGIGGYNLDEDKAAEIQDAFTTYCVEMLNKK